MVGPVDADVFQQMVLCEDVPVGEFCFDADGRWIVGHADAAEVQQMVLGDVVQLDGCWGLMPPLGKVPNNVQDVEDDVRLDDNLLEVVGS